MTGFNRQRRRVFPAFTRLRRDVVVAVTIVGVFILGLAVARVAALPSGPVVLDRGQSVNVSCEGGAPAVARTERGGYQVTCGATVAAPSKAGAPTVAEAFAPTTAHASEHADVGACGEPLDAWHPPVVNGCATGHEHGDGPPDWIAQAGYSVTFHGDFNTSPTEHTYKHAAMKGFLARFGDVDIYFRIHAASNVLDRSARYHSYEVWARDPSGGVSHWQGWYNSGDPVADRYPRRRGVETAKRPVVLVVDQTSLDQGIACEQWYAATATWSWDFGWTICGVNALFYPGENGQQDQQFWRAPAGGPGVGTLRRLEASWYDNSHGRNHPVGAFWATQFGEIVTGPDDERCTGSTTKFGQTYQNVCLEQYIAPTMPEVAYPSYNAEQRQFDGTGVRSPN